MNSIQYSRDQTFRMEPYCYDGPNCDGIKPRWMTCYPKEGDCEEGETLKLEIRAASLPPGSRITIEIPCCPKCGDPANLHADYRKEYKEWPNCTCGFSWKEWTIDNYS